MVTQLDYVLSKLLIILLTVVALGSPWMFGAWEIWWFWPFMGCILAAGLCYSIKLILAPTGGTRALTIPDIGFLAISAWAPFLIYALVRSVQAEVRMDAERSLLLQSSPLLLATMVSTGLKQTQQRKLLILMLFNYMALGLYGILNHYLAGNVWVLWKPGFPQYQSEHGVLRATGPYYCPDHFAGLMEFALVMALPMFLTRDATRLHRFFAAGLACISLWAIILTRSRGGGLAASVGLAAGVLLCTMSWPKGKRWAIRYAGASIMTVGLAILIFHGGHYMQRFLNYPWSSFANSERYQMTAAALRAWKSAPLFGVGPGMHANLWPHFAPSPDGNRTTGSWPSFPNNHYHSFEAHNDWAQLLEEYGVAGMILFLAGAGTTAAALFRRWRRQANDCILHPHCSSPEWAIPGVLLAGVVMTVHSFGDFNLQIPATTWQLGLLAGVAFGLSKRSQSTGTTSC